MVSICFNHFNPRGFRCHIAGNGRFHTWGESPSSSRGPPILAWFSAVQARTDLGLSGGKSQNLLEKYRNIRESLMVSPQKSHARNWHDFGVRYGHVKNPETHDMTVFLAISCCFCVCGWEINRFPCVPVPSAVGSCGPRCRVWTCLDTSRDTLLHLFNQFQSLSWE